MSLLHDDAFLAHLSQCKASAKQQVNSMIDAIYAKVLLDLKLWLNKHDSNDSVHALGLNNMSLSHLQSHSNHFPIKNEIDSDCEENGTDHNLPGESINWQPTQPEPLQPTHSNTLHYSSHKIEKNKIVVDDEDKEDGQVGVNSRTIQHNSNEQFANDRGYLQDNSEIDDDDNENIGNGEIRELGGHKKFNRLPQNALTQLQSDQQQMHFDDDLVFDQETLDEVKREIEEEEKMNRRENEHEGGDERHDEEGDQMESDQTIDTQTAFGEHFQHNSDESMVIQQDESEANNAIGEEVIATECTTNQIQPNLVQPNGHFQCPHCHKSFVYRSILQQHLRVHTRERPFPCEQCGKRFSRHSSLTTHQLIHQNIKSFRCHECDKDFRLRGDLARHKQIHQNIKRFQCHECEKQFTLKQYLDSHLRIHSGERPFECRFCAQSFTQSNTRDRHEQAIHLHVKPYRCKQCGHTATHQTTIIQHIRMVHFGLPQTIKKQQERNIVDHRDPRELLEKM